MTAFFVSFPIILLVWCCAIEHLMTSRTPKSWIFSTNSTFSTSCGTHFYSIILCKFFLKLLWTCYHWLNFYFPSAVFILKYYLNRYFLNDTWFLSKTFKVLYCLVSSLWLFIYKLFPPESLTISVYYFTFLSIFHNFRADSTDCNNRFRQRYKHKLSSRFPLPIQQWCKNIQPKNTK